MKRLLVAALSTLTVAAAIPAQAQEIAAVNQNKTQPIAQVIAQVTPFNLVEHGYQGYFSEQGIPSNGAFLSGVRTGKIKAEDLVKGGIARGRLTSATLSDRNYLSAVQTQLDTLNRN
jgi:hypothetical protein